jgi:hypothetical protein
MKGAFGLATSGVEIYSMKPELPGRRFLRPAVAKFCRLGVCLFMLLGVAACGFQLDFEAETVFFPDAAATRETRFFASSEAAFKDQLERRLYVLPPGGEWGSGVRKRIADGKELESTHFYEVKERYPPGSPIASDYVRKARFSEGAAHNEPRLKVRDYLFVKIFDYEERFKDIVTPESADRAVQRFYGDVIHHGARYLAPDGLPDAQTERVLRATFNPLLERFLKVFHSEGIKPAFASFKDDGEFHDALEPEQIVTRVIKVLPPPAGHNLESWRNTVAAAYKKALETETPDAPTWEEDLFGAHGFRLFDSYRFALVTTLPGEVLEHNATRREGNRLVWVFGNDVFVLKNYDLRARSRLVYPERIGVAGVALAAIILGLWWFRRRRRER